MNDTISERDRGMRIVAAVAFCTFIIVVVVVAWRPWSGGGYQYIDSRADWTAFLKPLDEFATLAETQKINLAPNRLYGNDFEMNYAWRLPHSAALAELMANEWDLAPADAGHSFITAIHGIAPRDWHTEQNGGEVECLVSRPLLAGDEGPLFGVIHDRRRGLTFVRYYFNF